MVEHFASTGKVLVCKPSSAGGKEGKVRGRKGERKEGRRERERREGKEARERGRKSNEDFKGSPNISLLCFCLFVCCLEFVYGHLETERGWREVTRRCSLASSSIPC